MKPSDRLLLSQTRVIEILNRISLPAAPFHERAVAREILGLLSPLTAHPGVTVSLDRYGNIIGQFWNAGTHIEHCMALASHMDHPGFGLVSSLGSNLDAEILGGVPRGDVLRNCPVLVCHDDRTIPGQIVEEIDGKKDTVRITLNSPFDGDLSQAFAVPDVTRFAVDPPLIHGRAMDDLAGCAMQTAVFETIVSRGIPIDLMVIYHRAEEVGFIGANGACELESIPRHALVVSLEASKTLEGAAIGGGIVIRTGDKAFLFDSNAQMVLERAAASLEVEGISTQMRRMDGGTCEASLYRAYGYDTTAIAIPLLNYHNHGDHAVSAEAVSIYDLNSGVDLLVRTAEILPQIRRVSRFGFLRDAQQRFAMNRNRLLMPWGIS